MSSTPVTDAITTTLHTHTPLHVLYRFICALHLLDALPSLYSCASVNALYCTSLHILLSPSFPSLPHRPPLVGYDAHRGERGMNRVIAAQMGLDSGREDWNSCRGEKERTDCHRFALPLPLPFSLPSCSPPLCMDAVHVAVGHWSPIDVRCLISIVSCDHPCSAVHPPSLCP
jgi:hypothetical protein